MVEDRVHKVSLEMMASLVRSEARPNADLRLLVELDGVQFPILINRHPKSERLLVLYNGAVDRKRSSTGIVFQRSSWVGEFNATRIHFADPTILPFPDMSIGWGQLSKNAWAIPGYISILNLIRKDLNGIGASKTLHYGSSAGGFQAMMAACLDRGSTALVNNPQTDVTQFWPNAQAKLFRNVFEDDEVGTESLALYPWRFRCLDFFEREGYIPNLRIASNIASEKDFRGHLLPFVEGLGRVNDSGNRVSIDAYWNRRQAHNPLGRNATIQLVNRELAQLA